jgi:NAD(P)-dependent dehydrogenase (short-subunit alcohol dehydrogenase family)
MTGRVEGKVALITGGASGIGRATALRLAEEGAAVVLTDMQAEAGEGVAEEIRAAGGKADFLLHDVTDEADWARVVAEVKRLHGRLDILFNNAGIGGAGGPAVDISLESWKRVHSVNVEGVFLGVKHALPLMRAGGGGSIVNVSSIAGLVGSIGGHGYAASKGAVRIFSKSVAMECANLKDGVRVNSIHPGIIDTAIWGRRPGEAPKTQDNAYPRPDLQALVDATTPLGVVGQPIDIANGVLFLASDEARFITGSELVIDGGYVAR